MLHGWNKWLSKPEAQAKIKERMDTYLAEREREYMAVVDNLIANTSLIGPGPAAELREMVYG